MSPLIAATFIVSGICLAVSVLHFLIFFRRPEIKTNLFFALMCLCAAGAAFLQACGYHATNLGGFVTIHKMQITFEGIQWIMLTWFIVHYTGTARRLLAGAVTAGYALAIVKNIISPYGVLYSKIESIKWIALPWGERLATATGSPNLWRFIPDISWILLIYMGVESSVRMGRRAQRPRALLLGASLFVFLGLAYLHDTLLDLGVVGPPSLFSLAFLGLIVVMSLSISDEVVKSSKLSREVATNERRWRSLLENVRLLVAGVDRNERINYVNPHFMAVSGYSRKESLGKPVDEFVPEEGREDVLEHYDQAMGGNVRLHHERALIRKDGSKRQIAWSDVVLRDPNDRITGTLSIGEDITDRKRAEEARDKALKELEALKGRLEEENIYLKEELQQDHGFKEIIGKSNALLYVLSRVRQVAETETTVMIEGETGVGKELVARGIHEASHRSKGPFIRVNCAALPPSLIESELFGYEPGAFTGAERLRKGRFELADGGTILLDEITELPPPTQAKLLHVLQEKQFERLGGLTTLRVDVRVIAATNRDLGQEMESGRFRADLFYRLNVYPITVPPLRHRPDDIPLLVKHFVQRFAVRMGKKIEEIPAALMEQLMAYDWPGNVRELQNVLERAVITCPNHILRLPQELSISTRRPDASPFPEEGLTSLEAIERQHILRTLEATGWRISGPKGAASILGVNPSTLRSRLKKHDLRRS